MKLSKRLQALANVIIKYKKGDILADIGTDHAYLPCYLVEKGVITKAYACDVSEGPFNSSKETINLHHLNDQVIPLQGDGLNPILDKKVDMISIAGMGSYLMVDILKDKEKYLKRVNTLYLQSNANLDYLRAFLFENGFVIVDEEMVEDAGHIYEILVVKHVAKKPLYSEFDVQFGPILKNLQPALFKQKWEKQYAIYENIRSGLPQGHPRYCEVTHQMDLIKEVLDVSK